MPIARRAGVALAAFGVAAAATLGLGADAASALRGAGCAGQSSLYPPAQCGTGGGGTGVPLAVSNTAGAPGTSFTVVVSRGPCAPGSTVTIDLVRAVPGQTPVRLATTTATGDGGVPATSVGVPAGSPPGVYVVFATCPAPGGDVAVMTTGFVVEPAPGATSHAAGGSGGAGVVGSTTGSAGGPAARVANDPASAVPSWSPPSTWSTAAVRAAVGQAVDAALAGFAGGVAGPAATDVAAADSAGVEDGGGLAAGWYAAIVAALLAMTGGLAWRRRARGETATGGGVTS